MLIPSIRQISVLFALYVLSFSAIFFSLTTTSRETAVKFNFIFFFCGYFVKFLKSNKIVLFQLNLSEAKFLEDPVYTL